MGEAQALGVITISDTVDGADNGGGSGIGFNFFAQLGDVLIEGAAVGGVVHAPTDIEEGVAVDDFSLLLVQKQKDMEIAWADLDFLCVPSCS